MLSAVRWLQRVVWSGDRWRSPGAETVEALPEWRVVALGVRGKKMQDETRVVAGGHARKVNFYLVRKETPT